MSYQFEPTTASRFIYFNKDSDTFKINFNDVDEEVDNVAIWITLDTFDVEAAAKGIE